MCEEKDDFLTFRDVAKRLKVGMKKARSIMKSDGFPSFKIGRRIYVKRKDFEEWFENIAGKKVD